MGYLLIIRHWFMVRIRLALGGSRKNPFYYVVITDSRNARNGKFIERVGFFNPIKFKLNKELYINSDRIQYWLNRGAQPSNRVSSLIKQVKFLKNEKNICNVT